MVQHDRALLQLEAHPHPGSRVQGQRSSLHELEKSDACYSRISDFNMLGRADSHERVRLWNGGAQIVHLTITPVNLLSERPPLPSDDFRPLTRSFAIGISTLDELVAPFESDSLFDAETDAFELQRLHIVAEHDDADVDLVAGPVACPLPEDLELDVILGDVVIIVAVVHRPQAVQLVLLEHDGMSGLDDAADGFFAEEALLGLDAQRSDELVGDFALLVELG